MEATPVQKKTQAERVDHCLIMAWVSGQAEDIPLTIREIINFKQLYAKGDISE